MSRRTTVQWESLEFALAEGANSLGRPILR